MRYHLVLPFIGWMFRNMFSGVFAFNRKYRNNMEDNPALSLFAGTICSFVFTAFMTLFAAGLFDDFHHVRYAAITALVSSVGYVIITFFTTLFEKFLDDRKQMFDDIKRS